MLKQFIDSMDDENEYDFIANNYYQMTKEDLKTILLEYIYAPHCISKEVEDKVRENVREELEEREIFG